MNAQQKSKTYQRRFNNQLRQVKFQALGHRCSSTIKVHFEDRVLTEPARTVGLIIV